MIDEIVINKTEILTTYQNMDSLIKKAIEILYSDNWDNYNPFENIIIFENVEESLINKDCRKKIDKESNKCELSGKTGVYVFINENLPIYIGLGGIGKNDNLRTRLNAEVKTTATHNNATLSKNIQDIDAVLLNREISAEESLNKIKNSKIIVFVVGDMTDENKDKTKMLEMALIALFKPRYNK